MQSFNLLDDYELEFMLEINSETEGTLKVLKTRDAVTVDSTTKLRIEDEIKCKESYVFPDEQLLVKARVHHMKQVRHIFH